MRYRPISILAILMLVHASEASAQEWRAEGKGTGVRATFTQKGRPAGIQFACIGEGRVRTLVSGNGARFSEDRDLSLILSVDGLARIRSIRAEREPNGTGSRFVRTDPVAALEDLFAALRKGKELELSSPAGHWRLPLKGSGNALGALLQQCR